MPLPEQREQIIAHFFDETDFNDTLLIYSNILTSKLIDYLSLYQNANQNMNETQFAFIKGTEVITRLAAINSKMYAFVLEYLLEGFSHLGLSAVTDYLSTLPNFDAGCMDSETMMKIETLVNPFRKIIIGADAPEIETLDINGNNFVLDSISSPYTIVVFWSVTCPHCLDLMPKLKQFAKQHPEYSLVSVILSPENETLNEYINEQGLNWTHIVEGQGWKGQLVQDYNVYGTPTLYVLDKDKKIISKPSGIEELILVADQNQQ